MNNAQRFLTLALDPAEMFHAIGCTPDPWQATVLRSTAPRVILNCCRQAGKSTTVAAMALHKAIFQKESLILLLSRAQRQATELFRKVVDFYVAIGRPVPMHAESLLRLELTNGSRIVALPGKEANIRSYSGVDLLVIDEAARVGDDLYKSVRPMLAVSGGRLVVLSTPFGRRGFFHDAWIDDAQEWERHEITARQNPRITSEFLDEELRVLGQSWFDQEYMCSFEALEGLVYPEFPKCFVEMVPPATGKWIGGIDFGFHNPFAAVWGVLDNQDVLWICKEYYKRSAPLSENASHLPKNIRWWCDPAGANEIAELRCAGFVAGKADNHIRPGIAAVTARIQTGRLKVYKFGCPNLCNEAALYRYPNPAERAVIGENPVDADNHAMAALRYLVTRIDQKFMAKARKLQHAMVTTETEEAATEATKTNRNHWLDPRNPALWTPLN